mgnify:CR=1 FL=1|jgi:hypothetical protein
MAGPFGAGEKTITSAGTRETLVATATYVRAVVVIAKNGNTNQVYLGDETVDNTVNDGLDSGDSLPLNADVAFDLATIYVDVDTSGEGVDYYYVLG